MSRCSTVTLDVLQQRGMERIGWWNRNGSKQNIRAKPWPRWSVCGNFIFALSVIDLQTYLVLWIVFQILNVKDINLFSWVCSYPLLEIRALIFRVRFRVHVKDEMAGPKPCLYMRDRNCCIYWTTSWAKHFRLFMSLFFSFVCL